MAVKLRTYRGSTNKGAPRGARTKTSVYRTSNQKDGIIVVFREHGGVGEEHIYVYTYASCGQNAVEIMKYFVKQGYGLNRYINANKPPYDPSPDIYGINNVSTPQSRMIESEFVENKSAISDFDWIEYFGKD